MRHSVAEPGCLIEAQVGYIVKLIYYAFFISTIGRYVITAESLSPVRRSISVPSDRNKNTWIALCHRPSQAEDSSDTDQDHQQLTRFLFEGFEDVE